MHYKEGGHFTCPNGHSRGWNQAQGQRPEVKLAAELDKAKRDRAEAIRHSEILQGKLDLAAEEVAVKKRKHAQLTECPHCGRKVRGLALHIHHAHPECVGTTGDN